MKLNKKSRDKIFDLHLGLTFDWRETGLLRWRIFLWMLFFGVCAFAAGLFVHVEVPEIRSREEQLVIRMQSLRVVRCRPVRL